MNIRIQSIHFDADAKLLEFIEKRVLKLETYFDKIIDTAIFLKLDAENSNVKDKIVEIKINIPNSTLFATGVSKAFEESTDEAIESLRKQLEKYKEKLRN